MAGEKDTGRGEAGDGAGPGQAGADEDDASGGRYSVIAEARALQTEMQGIDASGLTETTRSIISFVKAQREMDALKRERDFREGRDDRLDLAGEQRLREDLLRRLDALADDWRKNGIPEFARAGRPEDHRP